MYMISVQNLRQQLNGNKTFLLILILLAFQSCFSQRFNSEQKYLRNEYEKNVSKPATDSNITQQPGKEEDIKIVEKKHDTLRIALMLPLELNLIYDEEFSQSSRSRLAQSFYSGFKLALSEHDSGRFVLIKVFDNEGLEETTSKLLQKNLDNFRPDVVIGPFNSRNNALTCNWTHQQNIWQISPYQLNYSCLQTHPKLLSFQIDPSLIFRKMIEHAENYYPSANLIICTKDSNEQDVLQRSIRDSRKFVKINTCILDQLNWKQAPYAKYIQEDKKNLLIFTQGNEMVISSILSKLVTTESEVHCIVPLSWLNMKSLDINYLQKINTVFIGREQIDYHDSLTQMIVHKYRKKYRNELDQFSLDGYRIGKYVCNNSWSNEFDPLNARTKCFYFEKQADMQGFNLINVSSYIFYENELIPYSKYLKKIEEKEVEKKE